MDKDNYTEEQWEWFESMMRDFGLSRDKKNFSKRFKARIHREAKALGTTPESVVLVWRMLAKAQVNDFKEMGIV